MTASNMGKGPEKSFNAKEERKLRKPLIEKRRRERINCSLEQLKGIMVDAYNLDQSKLEKADVLEITVQHMEGLQRGQGAGSPAPSMTFESRQRYSSGYIQCMHEVHNLLLSCPGMDKTLGARLLNHLLKSLPHISAESPGPARSASPLPSSAAPSPRSARSPGSPHSSPAAPPVREGRGGSGIPARDQPSPAPQAGHAHPALPPFFPGGDPSMWRPW
ncbi:hairy-related 8a [Denticeps clupeoides]|uniref:Uncharacterized protein n=1 Tax=Denticeps clupeoides TaxID=299321 RepID=A0AAY4ART5_9TELE|nr:transcription cofactor HES-6-like [Denticeps clupeoides]